MKTQIIVPTVDVESKTLLEEIEARENSIEHTQFMLIKLWISQGDDLMKLQEQESCSQNGLTALTGIKRSTIQVYIKLAKDIRMLAKLNSGHHGSQLEQFTQKQLLKLTKLSDDAFEASLDAGCIVEDRTDTKESYMLKNDNIIKSSNKIELIKKLTMDVLIERESEKSKSTMFTGKAVSQMNSDGRVIAHFPSALDAQTSTGIDRMTIGKVCRGTGISAGGFYWKFAVYGCLI